MKGALLILFTLLIIGMLLYIYDVAIWRKRHPQDAVEPPQRSESDIPEKSVVVEENVNEGNIGDGGICCGMHTVCEKTNLSPLTGEIVYYDDEELDRFAGKDPKDYTAEEIEEFRDVLLTLLPEDVAGWSRSLQVRGINLPTDVREELLMIVQDLRQK